MQELNTLVLAIPWAAGPGIEPFTRAFWLQQAIAAAGTLVSIRWVISLASTRPRSRPRNVLRFPTRR